MGGVYDTGSGVAIPESAMILSMIFIKSGVTLNNAKFYPMLIEGNEKKAYEPYTGGIASPNPDYPQEINVLTGSQKVTSCNKNLFGKTDCVNGKALGDDGTLVDNAEYSTSNYRVINSNTSMTISGMTWGRICLYDETKAFISLVTNNSTRDVSFDTPKNARYYKLSSTTDSLNNVQLEEKSTATSFEEYQETSITFDIPDDEFVGYIDENHKDELDVIYNETDGQWHKVLKKKIGKKIIDSNDNTLIKNTNSSTEDTLVIQVQEDNLDTNIKNTKSNYFTFALVTTVGTVRGASNYILMGLSTQDYPTVDSYKAWLSTHNVEVYYVLAAPYEIDLGTVDMPLSYNEVTNIFTDSDLLPTINAKYYRNFTKTIQNLQVNEMTLKQELIDINNRLTALETAMASESEAILDDIQEQ